MEIDEYIKNNLDSTDLEVARALGIKKDGVRARRRRMGLTKTNAGTKSMVSDDGKWREIGDKLVSALKNQGVESDMIGTVKNIKVSHWTTTIKNSDGEAEQHPNEGVQLVLDPAFKEGPKWPVVQQAAQVPIKLPKQSKSKNKTKTAIILPDPQIGYRRNIVDDSFDPFHDEKAMGIATQIINDIQPDVIINLGDFLDNACFSRFTQEPGFALTTQRSINRGYRFLVEQRSSAPNADVILLEGNHEKRMANAIITNAQAAFGLHRAEKPDNWPVLSIPFLLRLDELGVKYVDGYPNGEYWINENIKCIHGNKVRSNGSTAQAIVVDERVSTIFGHVHRIELQYKTVNVREGFKTSLAFTPGTLARIDGAVPSTNGGVDEWGNAKTHYENWQQGIGVVNYEDGDGDFHVHGIHIHDGKAMYNGKLYKGK